MSPVSGDTELVRGVGGEDDVMGDTNGTSGDSTNRPDDNDDDDVDDDDDDDDEAV